MTKNWKGAKVGTYVAPKSRKNEICLQKDFTALFGIRNSRKLSSNHGSTTKLTMEQNGNLNF
jgi:hypothetical protein